MRRKIIIDEEILSWKIYVKGKFKDYDPIKNWKKN